VEPRDEDGGHGAGGGGHGGGHEHQGDGRGVGGEHRAAVEAEPAEPEQERADGGQRQVVAEDGSHAAVGVYLPRRGSEKDGHHQRAPAAHGVDEGRAGEVVEAQLLEEAAAPHPAARDGVADADEERREDEEGAELHAAGHGARDDGRGGRGEHGLKEEVRVPSVPGVVVRGEVRLDGGRVARVDGDEAAEGPEREEAVELARVHHVEPDEPVGQQADADDHRVLEEDVHRVLRAGQAALERGEPEVHDEHEAAGEHDPEVIEGPRDLVDSGPDGLEGGWGGWLVGEGDAGHGAKRHDAEGGDGGWTTR
jgi:hypothetical protein